MSLHEQDTVFNDEQIRDTVVHISAGSQIKGFIPKTILIKNTLNQAVSIDCEGSDKLSFADIWPIGNTVNIGASTNSYITLSDYIPFFRIKATCATAPISGGLTAHIEKVAD